MGSLAAVTLAMALAVTGCSSSSGTDSGNGSSGSAAATGGSGSGGGKCDGVALGFFGALTGDAANLGINIYNGAKLAVDQHNQKNADCKVDLVKLDSQGSPDQAPGLAQQAINNKSIVGIVGPAFSGESKAADPLFNEAGLPIITASATNPKLAENGWKIFHRILGNDNSQGPAAAKYISDVLKADKVAVVDDASEYGKGLADIVRQTLGSKVVVNDTVQTGQTDFSATVTKVKSSGATALFYGGYYAEAGLLRKQLSDAGAQVTLVAGDGVKDDGYVKAAGAQAAAGSILTCPCLPPDKAAGSFASDYKAAFNTAPGTYSAEGYDAANVFLAGIDAGKTDRSSLNDFVSGYKGQGITKQIAFDDKGEVANVSVWAYKVDDSGNIVADQEIK
ncbi:MAG: branched-chain amino acid ABC transporter substrate-binding protein [Actinomycetales bacterium]